MNRLQSEFCENLKLFRLTRKFSKRSLSKKLNMTAYHYKQLENGNKEPTLEEIYLILKFFDITPNDLFGYPVEYYISNENEIILNQ